jgi:uncharacterized protein (DUF488 family)
MLRRLLTIGVYGFDEAGFFQKLRAAGVETFCDIRGRRGVRGAQYAFANSQRLQRRLADLGIRYLHFPELAPSQALRNRQAAADTAAGIPKRQRAELSPEFAAGYQKECLSKFQSSAFVERLGPEAGCVVLFCVECEPVACHRSLLAERLHKDLGIEVRHLKPE